MRDSARARTAVSSALFSCACSAAPLSAALAFAAATCCAASAAQSALLFSNVASHSDFFSASTLCAQQGHTQGEKHRQRRRRVV